MRDCAPNEQLYRDATAAVYGNELHDDVPDREKDEVRVKNRLGSR